MAPLHSHSQTISLTLRTMLPPSAETATAVQLNLVRAAPTAPDFNLLPTLATTPDSMPKENVEQIERAERRGKSHR